MHQQLTVSVIMITYNHEKYIEQAINGVLIQESNFQIELIIVNDCSPDNTDKIVKQIIKNYTGSIKINYYRHKKNKGISKNFKWSLQKAKGKYIAICEGDDYWIDKLKLKKQVVFLDNNAQYELVATERNSYHQQRDIFLFPRSLKNKLQDSFAFKNLLLGEAPISTLTTLFRTKTINKYIELSKTTNLSFFDFSIWIFISYHGKIKILNDVTAVYRILQKSASHSVDPKKKWNLKSKYFSDLKFFVQYFNIKNKVLLKKIFYNKAKIYYIIAAKAKNKEAIKEFSKIFIQNKDFSRYILLIIGKKMPYLIKTAILYEKFLRKIK